MNNSEIEFFKEGWETDNCTGIGRLFSQQSQDAVHASGIVLTEESLAEKLHSYNGYFALVSNKGDEIIAAVDHLQTYSLYYALHDETFYLSDSAHWIHSQIGGEETKEHCLEYLLFGYTLDNHTRSAEVNQLRSGEYLVADLSESSPVVNKERYFKYPDDLDAVPEYREYSERELLDKLDEVHTNCFERLETFADGRPLAVSLSGGYDSRLVLLMLVRMDYEDVYAFTHGKPADAEVERAKEIADLVDVPWKHVPYEHEQWYNWFRTSMRKELDSYLDEISEVPAVDDAPAVEALRDGEFLPKNSVILTGDHVSAISGRLSSEFSLRSTMAENRLVTEILDLYIRWDTRCDWNEDFDTTLRETIRNIVEIDSDMSNEEAAKRFERFGWQERQSKLIPRNEIYEFYEFDWWLPLWDREYVEFWQNVPVDYRQGKELHKKYIVELMAEVTGYSHAEAKDSFKSGWSPQSRVDRTIDQLDKSLRQYPALDRVLRPLYFKLARDPPAYDSDPKFGIMSEEFFEEIPTGEYYIHGYRILDSLGYISIENEELNQFPNEVSLPQW